jgi:hypothetical protein
VLGLAREGRSVVDFGSGGARVRRGNSDGDGDSGHPGSIPLARSKRIARWTFSACRRGWGRRGAVRLGGSQISACRRAQEREEERARERKKRKWPARVSSAAASDTCRHRGRRREL